MIEKEHFKEKGEGKVKWKEKRRILTALATAVKKDATTSIRKQTDALKDHKKNVRTVIK